MSTGAADNEREEHRRASALNERALLDLPLAQFLWRVGVQQRCIYKGRFDAHESAKFPFNYVGAHTA